MKISKILGKWLMVRSIACMAVLAIMLYAVPVHAVPIIDFSTGIDGMGGTITPGPTITGTGILIGTLTAVGTTADGVYDVSGAGVGASGSTALLSFAYDGGGTNWVKIVGGIPTLSIADGTTLVSGSFTSLTYFPGIGIMATGVDIKDAGLLSALGIAPGTPFELFGFSIGFDPLPLGGSIKVLSTDIINTAVPEPGTLLLLGSGLTVLGFIGRRSKSIAGKSIKKL